MVYRGSAIVISHKSKCGKESEKGVAVMMSRHVKPEGGKYKQSEPQDFFRELGRQELLRRRGDASGHELL